MFFLNLSSKIIDIIKKKRKLTPLCRQFVPGNRK